MIVIAKRKMVKGWKKRVLKLCFEKLKDPLNFLIIRKNVTPKKGSGNECSVHIFRIRKHIMQVKYHMQS